MTGPPNAAYRRYLGRIALAALLYLAAIFIAAKLLHGAAPVNPLAVSLALLPGAAVVMMIFAMARLLVELEDEYLRMLEVRKALVATGLTLALASVWGLLESFTAVPRLPVFWVFPLWCFGLVFGAIANRIKFGTAGLM